MSSDGIQVHDDLDASSGDGQDSASVPGAQDGVVATPNAWR